VKAVIAMLKEGRGTQFWPDAVDAMSLAL